MEKQRNTEKKKKLTRCCEDDNLDWESINKYLKMSREERDKAIEAEIKRWNSLTEAGIRSRKKKKKENVIMRKALTNVGAFVLEEPMKIECTVEELK